MKQYHILYSGHVQGVGFRYTVHQLAKQFEMTGWVRNLPNGSVELVAEGSGDALRGLCRDIEDRFQGYIRDKQISEKEITSPEFNAFTITF